MEHLYSLLEKITSLNGRANIHTIRFLRYTTAGTGTFLIDFFLLWFLTDALHIYYLISGALSFIIATTIHYSIIRRWAFFGTTRRITAGYVYYINILCIGLILTLVCLKALVDYTSMNYLVARLIVAGFVGIWNYSANFFLNFKPHKTPDY